MIQRKNTIRTHCQECGVRLLASERSTTDSGNQKKLCANCKKESQLNESIAIKIRNPKGKGYLLNGQKNSGVPTRGTNKQLKSFYHEEIKQMTREMDSQRYANSRQGIKQHQKQVTKLSDDISLNAKSLMNRHTGIQSKQSVRNTSVDGLDEEEEARK